MDRRQVSITPQAAAVKKMPVQRYPNLDQLPVLRQLAGIDGIHVAKLRVTAPGAKNRVNAPK